MLGKREAMRIKSDTLNILNTFVAQCFDCAPLVFFWKGGGLGGGGKPGKGSQKILHGCMSIFEGKRGHP